MTQPDLTEWDEDLDSLPEEEYAALVRAISWARGFGLLFVQCAQSALQQSLLLRSFGSAGSGFELFAAGDRAGSR